MVIAAASGCGETRVPTAPDPVGPTPLTISVQPQSQPVAPGGSVTLTVAAAGGSGTRTHQWYQGTAGNTSAPIAGATAATYTTPALSATTSYWVRVSDATGSVDSSTAVLTISSSPSPSASFEDQVLTLVNQERAAGATCGGTAYPPAGALYMHPQLRDAARAHSQDMATQDYFSHTSLDGRTFADRIRGAGYTASPIGENIGAGYASPQAVVAGWMSSPGHCVNIMSASYRALGVGYAYTSGSTYRHYWTQNFGGS